MAPDDDPRTEQAEQRLAANLRSARVRRSVSQAELARKMAVRGWPWHQQTVAKVEQGRRRLRLAEAQDIAVILGTTVEALSLPTAEQSTVEGLTEAAIRARRAWQRHAEATVTYRAVLAELRERIREARALGQAPGPVDDAISFAEETLLAAEQEVGRSPEAAEPRVRDGAR